MGREVVDADDVLDLGIVIAQQRSLAVTDDAERQRLRDLPRQVERGDPAGLDAVDSNALLERLRSAGEQQRLLKLTQRVMSSGGLINMGAQSIAGGARVHDKIADRVAQAIARRRVRESARKDA